MTQTAPSDLQRLIAPEALASASTDALKQTLLRLTEANEAEPIGQKAKLAKQLTPLFDELGRRNPTPDPREQVPLVLGTWRSHWSTIPFQDMLPGRLREQSYQVFADNGYYANAARYKPGSDLPLLSQVSQWLVSLDLMIVQTYTAGPEGWAIENVGIEQGVKFGAQPFTSTVAQRWFEQAVAKAIAKDGGVAPAQPDLSGMDERSAKKFEAVFQSKPQLEHIYIDRDFRLVRSRREAKQRPSFTVAVRCP
ncbi:MAG: hypothetical protein AAF289_16325 [Cyanobacteria bacterium P01_A01_bin.135]